MIRYISDKEIQEAVDRQAGSQPYKMEVRKGVNFREQYLTIFINPEAYHIDINVGWNGVKLEIVLFEVRRYEDDVIVDVPGVHIRTSG